MISIIAHLISLLIPEYPDLSFTAILTYAIFNIKQDITYFQERYGIARIFWKELSIKFIMFMSLIGISSAFAGNLSYASLVYLIVLPAFGFMEILIHTGNNNRKILSQFVSTPGPEDQIDTQSIIKFFEKNSHLDDFHSYPENSIYSKSGLYYNDLTLYSNLYHYYRKTFLDFFKIFTFFFILVGINSMYTGILEQEISPLIYRLVDILMVYAFNTKFVKGQNGIASELTQMSDLNKKQIVNLFLLFIPFIFLDKLYNLVLNSVYIYYNYFNYLFQGDPRVDGFFLGWHQFLLRSFIISIMFPILIRALIYYFRVIINTRIFDRTIDFEKIRSSYNWFPILVVVSIFDTIWNSWLIIRMYLMIYLSIEIPFNLTYHPYIELGVIILVFIYTKLRRKRKAQTQSEFINKTLRYYVILACIIGSEYLILELGRLFNPLFPYSGLYRNSRILFSNCTLLLLLFLLIYISMIFFKAMKKNNVPFQTFTFSILRSYFSQPSPFFVSDLEILAHFYSEKKNRDENPKKFIEFAHTYQHQLLCSQDKARLDQFILQFSQFKEENPKKLRKLSKINLITPFQDILWHLKCICVSILLGGSILLIMDVLIISPDFFTFTVFLSQNAWKLYWFVGLYFLIILPFSLVYSIKRWRTKANNIVYIFMTQILVVIILFLQLQI